MTANQPWRCLVQAKRSLGTTPSFDELTVREQVRGINAETKRALRLLAAHDYAAPSCNVELTRHWRTWFMKPAVVAYEIAHRAGGNKRTITFYLCPTKGKIVQSGNYPMGSPYWTDDNHYQDLPWGCNGTRRTVILQGLEEFCARVARSSKRT